MSQNRTIWRWTSFFCSSEKDNGAATGFVFWTYSSYKQEYEKLSSQTSWLHMYNPFAEEKNVEAKVKHELSIIKPHKLQQDLFCSYCRPAISTEKQLQLITFHHKLHKIGIKIFQATYFKGIVLTNSFNSLGALEGKLGTFWTSSNRPWKENYLWRVERHSDPKKKKKKELWLTIAIVQKKQCTLQKGRGRGKKDMFQHSWSADGYKSLEQ